MKKVIIIIFTNIILLSICFLILDFMFFSYNKNNFKNYIHDLTYKGYKENISNYKDVILNGQYSSKDNNDGDIITNWRNYRPVENPNSNKSIIIFGCSFAYGKYLNNNETFSHILSKLTGYRVYNHSHNGRGVQHMLYQLEDENFYKKFSKPNYIIYVYIPHHIRRSWLTCIGAHRDFYYKKIGNKLVINSPTPERYISGFFENILNKILGAEKLYQYKKGETDFYFQHIHQALNTIKEHWGNDVKLILFAYEDYYNDKVYLDNLKKLSDEGIIIIRLSDLSDKKYATDVKYHTSETDLHPNAKAWAEITPLFVNYMQNLNYLK